ncbi:MAG: endopeptidase La [Methanosphaera sp. rholeuAM130]|nr:MAG: endopeptidase La [Methanosphaera sp. rholeuAM130]
MSSQEESVNDYDGELPILIIPNTVFLPNTHMTIPLDKYNTENLLKSITENQEGIVLTPKTINEDNTKMEFYNIGSILKIEHIDENESEYVLDLNVKDKVKIIQLNENGEYYHAKYKIIEEENTITPEESEQMNKDINDTILEISKFIPNSEVFIRKIMNNTDIEEKISRIFPYMKITIDKKQEILEIDSVKIRALRIIQLLIEQKDAMGIQMDIARRINENMSKIHKENLLREQMKMIQEELNMTDSSKSRKTYRERIEEADLPKEVEEVAYEELNKLERQGQNNAEENIIRNYLDTILSLPWHKAKKHEIDIKKAQEQLDNDHYGLEKVKERIIQHLTVLKMKDEKQGSILLFVGPPGTGKTSLGRSIATALDRPYVRASLGGVKDESEIRGHRRTYLGALPGRIISGMKKAGQSNPVFVLDEVDKLTASINGNPTSALLEVLDPEQNDSFSDHYLEVAYDLSDVFFIATANSLQDIPGPLRDRLEIIELESYTKNEKMHIAKEHLMEEVLEEHGLSEDDLIIEDEAIATIIEEYTREAGVRELKRKLAAVCRKTTEKIVVENISRPFIVNKNVLYEILGNDKTSQKLVKDKNPAGVVTGLAWTSVGGDVLFIESVLIPGEGQLKLTGQLGDVMKESAQIALSLIKSRFASILKDSDFDKQDIHIHVPGGATPKDGPSAGVTLVTAIASLVTSIPVDSKLAMTGEISLSGEVLAVGGIKEKVIAAHRCGIKKVLLPKENMKHLEDIPDEVKNEMTFKAIERIEEVIEEALHIKLPEPNKLNVDLKNIQI